MNQKLRWGILSTANIGREVVIPSIRESSNSEVIAIASSKEIIEDIAAEFNIPKVFKSYDELLDCDEVDCVYIPLPNSLHVEWVKKAALKRKHVLCEKPAAITTIGLEEMLEACQNNGVVFMEAFMYQFHPQHQRVKEIISLGEIGEIKEIQATFSFEIDKSAPNIRLDKTLGGGALYDVGCYCVHSINNFLDVLPDEITATASVDDVFNVDLTVNGQLEYKNGIVGNFECSFEKPFKNEYKIIGSKGNIVVSRAFRPDVTEGEGIITIEKDDGNRRVEKVYGDQYALQIDYFTKAVQKGIIPSDQTKKTIQTLQLLEACMEAFQTGEIIKVEKLNS